MGMLNLELAQNPEAVYECERCSNAPILLSISPQSVQRPDDPADPARLDLVQCSQDAQTHLLAAAFKDLIPSGITS